jgi:hypothetical protein
MTFSLCLHILLDLILLMIGGVIRMRSIKKYKTEYNVPRRAFPLMFLKLTILKIGANNEATPLIRLNRKQRVVPQKRIAKVIPNMRSNVLGRGICNASIRVPNMINKITFRRISPPSDYGCSS